METFGCKVNQYDSEKLVTDLVNAGFVLTLSQYARIVIVNSCMVTEIAENKVKKQIAKLKRQHKFVVLTGCIANRNIETDADISIPEKSEIAKILSEKFTVISTEHTASASHRTRKFIKIQDGCNRFCSYCIIPYAREKIYSKPLDEIILEAKDAADKGFKEIVLIGINLATHVTPLAEIVEKCSDIYGIERIRLGSLEPDIFTDIERLAKLPKLCPHFHLSLQSGSDKILKLMNRRYTTAEYSELVEKIRKFFPDCGITTDIIVGFPQETDSDFKQTLEFAEKIKFSKIHVFPYSKRSGTKAAEMPQIDEYVKTVRADVLKNLDKKLKWEFYRTQIGKEYPVLFEFEKNPNAHTGHTPNFMRINVPNTDKISWQGKIMLTEVK
ncbi:tRNA (N(6)-L-threonylcarbamoyladenosine(37)-C(2))-methylthiotransferase MtaB [Clostridia bacterium]|nr:tRNA (N(6)-L-threonylcarbamoyladenosine(37)-C(2))-methylthiotransferase MtaB [Clostridia bacterium]